MKILTILGTRPEIIRLSRVIAKLDDCCEHSIVHTGQNYDVQLNQVFFEELGVRAPDHHLEARGSFSEQIGTILVGMERLLLELRPDRFLVLGDTNSSMAAIVAKRLGVPVFHMEAGNRCFDDRVPEEVNRRIIDHSSDILMPYTERSRQNLLREGIAGQRIFVTGNPIHEVIQHYEAKIEQSRILNELGLRPREYFLVTTHRQENVDSEPRLSGLADAFRRLHEKHEIPVIVSTHPRTRKRMQEFGVDAGADGVRFLEPFGFFDFISLEQNARCVLSDSGTVQEECTIFQVPSVTIREATERPETIERGANLLSGTAPEMILAAVERVMAAARGGIPPEYLVHNVSDTVANIVTGFVSGIGR